VASNSFTLDNAGYQTITLFTGLTLAANTQYFLTLAATNSNAITWGIDNSQPAVATAVGVVEGLAGYCTTDNPDCDNSFAPNSSGFQLSGGTPADALGFEPIFAVTAVSVAPEPGGVWMLVGAGMVAGVFRFRRGIGRADIGR
jgi:hypothetical protein